MRTRAAGSRSPLVLLAPATFFEGYDNFLLALALPLIREDFGLTVTEAGLVVSVAFAGSFGVLALLPLADRMGRRPLLAVTIVGYTAATVATAFSRGIVDLAAFQFAARVFLSTEYALASIVLIESSPDVRRGRRLGILASSQAVGMAAAGVGFLAVVATDSSWRLLYLVGALPLILIARARRSVPETLPDRRAGRSRPSLRHLPAKSLAGASLVSLFFALIGTGVPTFATLLVLDEWGWSLSDLHPLYFLAWAVGLSGFFVAGRLLDGWGRRPTSALFLAGATLAGLIAFTGDADLQRALGLGLVIFFLTGATPCVTAYATEPFPAAYRGRVGALLRGMNIAGAAIAPVLIGFLGDRLDSVGSALALVGLAGLAAAAAVLALLPETLARGRTQLGQASEAEAAP